MADSEAIGLADARAVDEFVKGIVRELNHARTRPAEYGTYIQEWERYFVGKSVHRAGRLPLTMTEGVGAVREAVEFLQLAPSTPALVLSDGMSRAAADHVRDQGPAGALSHAGSDSSQPWDRISRYGEWSGSVAENIWYGQAAPRDVVILLIIDDGIPDRGHRRNIFDPSFRRVGVAWGPHASYRSMCVITLAEGFTERRAREPR